MQRATDQARVLMHFLGRAATTAKRLKYVPEDPTHYISRSPECYG
jgi:hypothetical protein